MSPDAGLGMQLEESLIEGHRRRIISIASRLDWLPPLVARVALGMTFLRTGWVALHALPEVAVYFAKLGIPAPGVLAPLVAAVEFLCGGLLLGGLLTRLASLPLLATMVVAIITAKREEIHAMRDLFGMAEFLYVALLLWLGAFGAGLVSLDALVARRIRRPAAPPPA